MVLDGERPVVKYPWSSDSPLPAADESQGWWYFVGRHLPGLSVVLMVAILIIIVLWPFMVITVPSGHVGVLWKRFSGPGIFCWCFLPRGTVLNPQELRDEGLHVIWPWDTLFIYSLRLQSTTQKYNAISSDGVSVTVEMNIRYQLNHDSIAVFHKFIGPAYLVSLLAPELGSQAREVVSKYMAQDVYVSRQKIEQKIREQAQLSLGAHLNQLVQPEASEQENAVRYNQALQGSLNILDALVLSIDLPAPIVAAINRQTEQYYMVREYQYRVLREAQESQRKQIEADGIAAFQRTISQGISDSYLRWRGIEATLALAQSQNAKIVVIGTGKDGLPIILGNVDTPASGPTPQSGTGGITAPSVAPSAPSDKTPPGIAPTTLGGDGSSGTAPPKGASGSGVPSTSDKMPTADSSTAPISPEKSPSSLSPLGLIDIESALARISGILRSSGSDPSSGTGAKPKQ
jgi:regulator of protease activity HflC (stomatin/prohibitin superfamily)